MSKDKSFLPIVLFYGGLWGLAEATLGTVLHLLPIGVAGMIMFPIAFYFLFNVFKSTESQACVLMSGCVAAGIKLTGLAIPFQSPMSVINPAVSILLESVVVFAFVKSLAKKDKRYLKAFTLSLVAMTFFVASQALIFRPAEGLYLLPALPLVGYLFLNGLVGALIIGTWLNHPIGDLSYYTQRLSAIQPTVVILAAILLETGTRFF